MNIGTAMRKAADSIERHPKLFDFRSIFRPDPGCGTPGCAIGWIGYHLGIPVSDTLQTSRSGLSGYMFNTGLDGVINRWSSDFYDDLAALNPRWKTNAADCADALRQYADKYHPAKHSTKHTGLPESVRELFEVAA